VSSASDHVPISFRFSSNISSVVPGMRLYILRLRLRGDGCHFVILRRHDPSALLPACRSRSTFDANTGFAARHAHGDPLPLAQTFSSSDRLDIFNSP